MGRNKEVLYARQAEYRLRNRTNAIEYLSEHPCVDCGESDMCVLDFDHIDPDTKSFTVSRRLSGSTNSWKTILAEIQKCEVRCANCHRRRTAQQQEWYKSVTQALVA